MTNRVLAVEDSPTQAAVLKNCLQEAGFDVTLAANGAEALVLAEAERFGLVVSDVVMPEVGGYELCRRVKKIDPDLPVILITSLSDPLDVIHALDAGADNFLRKPYEPDELVQRVRSMLHNHELRHAGNTDDGLELSFLGKQFTINSDREQILDLLVTTFGDLVSANQQLRAHEQELARANEEVAARLAEAETERERLHGVLGAIPQAMAVVDPSGAIVEINDKLAELLGEEAFALRGSPVWDVLQFVDHAGNAIAVEHRALTECLTERRPASRGEGFDLFLRGADGEARPVISRAAPVVDRNGNLLGAVGTIDDIAKLQLYDPVTGLPGHGILIDRLQGAMDEAARERTLVGLLVVVLDRFDVLRSSLSPAVSAGIVSRISDVLEGAIDCDEVRQRSNSASVAYLGNAEFAVVLPAAETEADAVFIGELISERLSHTVDIEGVDVPTTVSVAVGVSEGDDEPAALLSAAAASARRQQGRGGGGVATSDAAVHAAVIARLQMEGELRRAIGEGEIVVHYQPQVQVAGGAPVGVEALVRWEHPERGLLGAGEIIPLAIESGLILPLSWHVLQSAARQVAQWRRELPGGAAMSLSVNVAAEQLADKDVAGRVRRITSEAGLDPSALVLEITEGTVMDDTSAIGERLAAVKALGVQIAIDDFGTGYSSLLQLRELPVDILKIDSRFVAGMCDQAGDAAIVTGSIRLGRALGLEIVAEGVETAEQLVQLRVLGCELALGYLFAKPLPADDLALWWRDQPGVAAPVTAPGSSGLEDQGEDETLAYLVHELKSPLVAISGFAQMLAEIPLSDKGREYLDVILRSTHELEGKLSSVREARDVLEGGMTLDPAPCDLAEVVRTLVNDMEAQLAPHPVRFESLGDATTLADRARLAQAVANLLTNAAKFSPDDAPIDVAVRSADREVLITVRDRGVGIPEHRRPELFRRFSRLGSRTKGMGVGLYVARVATIAHGGDVGHEPAPGGGSIFSIRIPQTSPAGLAAPPSGSANASQRVVASAADAAGPSGDRVSESPGTDARLRTVLYIEDSEASVALAQLVADGLPGVTLLAAEDGLTGIDMARSFKPGLVLLDLHLPDLAGEHVLASLRSDPQTADIPVVIASADIGDRSGALRASGAAGIIRKPFDLDRLRSVMRGDLPSEGAVEHESAAPALDARGRGDPLDRAMIAALEELAASSPAGDFDDAIVTFERAVMSSLGALERAVAAKQTLDLSQIAHEMAGTTANFGAHVVSQICREVELAVINGDVSRAADLVAGLAVEVDEALRALRLVFPTKSRA